MLNPNTKPEHVSSQFLATKRNELFHENLEQLLHAMVPANAAKHLLSVAAGQAVRTSIKPKSKPYTS